MLLRYENFRREQELFANDCLKAIEQKQVLIANAPTGLGKTDAVFASALYYAYENNLNVIFCTPKLSQHKLAVEIVRDVNKKYRTNFVVTDMFGKRHMCSNENVKSKDTNAFYRICENYCKKNLCEYYINVVDNQRYSIKMARKKVPVNVDAPEILNFSKEHGLCAYEFNIRNLRYSNVLICDYNHVFSQEIFNYISSISNFKKKNSILILDEVHNVYDRLSNKLSKRMSIKTIKRAYKELDKFKEICIIEDSKKYMTLKNKIKSFYKKYVQRCKFCLANETEIVVDRDFLEFALEDQEFLELLHYFGDIITLERKKTSQLLKIFGFLSTWETENIEEEIKFARILEKKDYKLSKYCLDVRNVSKIINDFYSAILMSGSINTEMTEKVLGIENAVKKNYKYPFRTDNILAIKISGITSKYSQRSSVMYSKIASTIRKIHETLQDKLVCYFPSFEFMENVNRYAANEMVVLAQKEKMDPKDVRALKENFVKIGDALFCVLGGSLAEGIEFKNNVVKAIVIVGMPLSKMNALTKAKIQYFDHHFGNGIDYAYIVPAMNKIVQACGRLIRSEKDYGIIVFLEDRIGYKNYSKHLPEHLSSIEIDGSRESMEKVIKRFMESKRNELLMLYEPDKYLKD
ncbi:MAG: ATP-dependent DNA helicase [Candidatus Micrarchaeota archaeon]|nr:ATP-dependent DNA helicase [Candidatus Micrarchaeota archaeon]